MKKSVLALLTAFSLIVTGGSLVWAAEIPSGTAKALSGETAESPSGMAGVPSGDAAVGLSGTPEAPSGEAAGIPPEGFYQGAAGTMWSNGDGTFRKNCWMHYDGRVYFIDADGIFRHGFLTIAGKRYYLPSDGILREGWISHEGSYYYVREDGSLAVSSVVDGRTLGPDGRMVSGIQAAEPVPQGNGSFDELVLTVLSRCTTDAMTSEQKLSAAYRYIMDLTSYERSYEMPSGDWTKRYASDVYTTGKGNCYRYAAAFAFLARAIGFDARVCTGQVRSSRGGLTPHGWAEVSIGGAWYLFDPDMQDGNQKDYFMKTPETYPTQPLLKEAEWEIRL